MICYGFVTDNSFKFNIVRMCPGLAVSISPIRASSAQKQPDDFINRVYGTYLMV